MTAHTPGPWVADPHYYIYVWAADSKMVADLPIAEDEGTHIARMRGVGRGATPDEQKANAKLIAAAPDLLLVLKRAKELLDCDGLNEKSFFFAECRDGHRCQRCVVALDAEAAIAKAEGK